MKTLRYCTKCRRDLPFSSFAKKAKGPGGYQFNCRECNAAYAAAWRSKNLERKREMDRRYAQENAEKARAKTREWARANPERKRETDRRYVQENAERIKEASAEYRKQNADRIRANKKAYALANREKLKAQRIATYYANAEANREAAKTWAKANPEKRRAQHATRKATKIRATPTWADREKIEDFYAYAVFLSEATGTPHHVDHIVPLRSAKVCGLHCEFNLQVLTAEANMKKRNNFESE